MKLKKQIRHLHQALRDQIINNLYMSHDHQPFVIKGTGCMVCRLVDVGNYPFALLQLAREHGLIPDWFPAEYELFNLIGADAFRKKISREMNFVSNMPKKRCSYCGGTVILLATLKTIAHLLIGKATPSYHYNCYECGHQMNMERNEIPLPLAKAILHRLALIKKRRQRKKNLINHIIQTHTEPHPQANHNPFPAQNNPFFEDLLR